jgi:hypothetical protein
LRQGNTPAAILAPAEGEPIIDPWTVSFGNFFVRNIINNHDLSQVIPFLIEIESLLLVMKTEM